MSKTSKEHTGSTGSGSTRPALHKFSSEIGDPAIVERFVSDYLGLLDTRIASVQQLMSTADTEATLMSILSLETSSAMIGLTDLVEVSRDLRRAVYESQRQLAATLFDLMVATVAVNREWLESQGFRARPPVG